jgi:type II secretory ATPase GspE/PulE/Tfp pilus assembly ATPase PilB-like protein
MVQGAYDSEDLIDSWTLTPEDHVRIAGKSRDNRLASIRAVRPNGMVLVTGPTGSGKTTTLYAALAALNSPEFKLMTVEDPVEYQLPGIQQVQVSPSIGLTFARALRSFLRHNPNIVMVGEIRDLETAEVAVQVALTGHLLLSSRPGRAG